MSAPTIVQITPTGQIVGSGPLPLVGLPGVLLFNANGTVSISSPSIVPLQPIASQTLNVTLNQQSCIINVYFKQIQVPIEQEIPTEPPFYAPINPCYLDLYVGTTLIIGGVICQNNNLIVRNTYLGFNGDLAFMDVTQNALNPGSDPVASGLGTQFLLTYWPDLA